MELKGVRRVDVLVAGGGPSGATAALLCARKGLRTVLLTGNPSPQVPWEPVQSLHPEVSRLLGALDLSSVLTDAYAGDFSVHPALMEEYVHAPSQGLHVLPSLLAASLRSQAAVGGSEILHASVVDCAAVDRYLTVTTSTRETFHTRWLLDGSGQMRCTARFFASVAAWYSPHLVVRTGAIAGVFPSDTAPATSFLPRPYGWLWHTQPTGGWSTWCALFSPEHRYEKEIRKWAAQSHPESLRTADARWRLQQAPDDFRVLLLGDAAAYLDPASGRGILQALQSAISATSAVAGCERGLHAATAVSRIHHDRTRTDFLRSAEALRSTYQAAGILEEDWSKEMS